MPRSAINSMAVVLVFFTVVSIVLMVVGAPRAITVSSIVVVTILSAILLWHVRFYARLEKIYRAEVPEEMLLCVRKHAWGDSYEYYAELRYPGSSSDRVDLKLPVIETDWIADLKKIEVVKVFGGKNDYGVIVETRLGVLWPTGPIFRMRVARRR